MRYNITFKHWVIKDLKAIDRQTAKALLDKIEAELTEHAGRYPALKGKFAGLRKFRAGNYRIVYSIVNDSTVLILRIAHRENAYRT